MSAVCPLCRAQIFNNHHCANGHMVPDRERIGARITVEVSLDVWKLIQLMGKDLEKFSGDLFSRGYKLGTEHSHCPDVVELVETFNSGMKEHLERCFGGKSGGERK